MNQKNQFFMALAFPFVMSQVQAQNSLQKMEPVSFADVTIDDRFWKPKINTVSRITIPVMIDKTEVKTARIRNFEKVAAKKGEKFEGGFFDDSDVYKALEAFAYSLKNNPDPALEKKADEWIEKIAAAQLPDGYLNTYFTLGDLNQRFTDMSAHEAYCAGHLIEAAVAYYNITGKRKLLDVAIRFADLLDKTFRLANRPWVPGHEEIELALVKLYKLTGNKNYLDLSDYFLQQRGYGKMVTKIFNPGKQYFQDNVPVKNATKICGHAVRAMYLYTGAADVGAAKNDPGYMQAMKTVWEDVVYRNMYITGGIGVSGGGEGFTVDYDLPNEQAYSETCASVGMVFWNQRMNLLTGESKYADVMERSLYNAALDGLALTGNRFFYANPLASSGQHTRSEWFDCACCPSNISRLIESVGDYIYARADDAAWINLFIGSSTTLYLENTTVHLKQTTNYPWDGKVQIEVDPKKPAEFKLYVRIPGWATGQPVPGDTYSYLDNSSETFTLTVNGNRASYTMENGYALISRKWKKGDRVELDLPMKIQRLVARSEIKDDINRVALQRGPLVYCFEHSDNNGKVRNIVIPDNAVITSEFEPGFMNGVVVLQAEAPVLITSGDGLSASTGKRKITAIPYYTWANRGEGQMSIWMPRKISDVSILAK